MARKRWRFESWSGGDHGKRKRSKSLKVGKRKRLERRRVVGGVELLGL
jgi:hypothetical protein